MTDGQIHATDYTNASRTMLFNIHTLQWDQELLDIFEIPANMLPEVKSSFEIFGQTEAVDRSQIPICGVLGDQQAALFAQCCFEAGDAKATYGTGCFVLMNTGTEPVKSKHGLLTTIAFAWQHEGQPDIYVTYALEGSVYSAGSTLQWLRDGLHMVKNVQEVETLARSVEDNAGVYLVPAFNGLGAPHWKSDARGMLTGLTQGTQPAHIARATLESIAFQATDVLEAMQEDSGIKIKNLRVDGGASNNDFAMQLQADLLGIDVIRPENVEATALGAAFCAGIATGFWDDHNEFYRIIQKNDTTYKSSGDPRKIEALKAGWKRAVEQVMV
jgi:glycerol kinase